MGTFCYFAKVSKIAAFSTFLHHFAKNLVYSAAIFLFKVGFVFQMIFIAEQKETTHYMMVFGSNHLPLQAVLSHKLFFLP
jgi:hypothetical protein